MHIIYDLILNIPVYSPTNLHVRIRETEHREREVKQKSVVAKEAVL